MAKITQSSNTVTTRQVVVREASTKPYVGFEHLTNVPDGWLYDIKRWSSAFDLRLPTLPRLSNPKLQGVSESVYFQSGVASCKSNDLLVKEVCELFSNHERSWVPIINNGYYYRFRTRHFLYSDNSRVQYIDPGNNKDDKNYIELTVKPDMMSPITAATYKRNPSTNTPEYFINAKQQYQFTGTYLNGEEQETVTAAGKILWDNVDYNKREFIVDHNQKNKTILRFNRDFVKTVGVIPTQYNDLGALEEIGISNGQEYMTFNLLHFPVIDDDTFHLYIADSVLGTYEEWTRVDTWWELYSDVDGYPTKRFYLDRDYGTVHFGGYTNGGVPGIGRSVLVAYRTTLRVEYEEENQYKQITAWSADVNPLIDHINQGFVCITHDELVPTSISLIMDKQPIPFTSEPKELGPITVGTDFGLLRASVTSQAGIPLSGVEVGFQMNPNTIGFLNGASATTSVSNGSGHAFAVYEPPVSADSLGEYTVAVRTSTDYPGNKEIIITDGQSLLGKENLVYVYQVLKDDLFLGYSNLDDWLQNEVEQPAWVVSGGAEAYQTWRNEIIQTYSLSEWQYDEASNFMNGRKVVIYQIIHDLIAYPYAGTDNYDPYAIHPLLGIQGAVVPLRPSLIERIEDELDPYFGKYRMIYPEDAIPDPDPNDPDNLVGGYWVVSSRLVRFRAHCYSSFYNNIIYSNQIVARISLPNYLLGEYITQDLEKIPFGWKFLDDLDNVAAGMDGATFITINPTSGPYQILDLINGTAPEDAPDGWASSPFKALGFEFNLDFEE